MARRSLYPLVDRLLDGGLAEFIATRRAEGQSFETIARDLQAEHDVVITGQTVSDWYRQHIAPETEPAA